MSMRVVGPSPYSRYSHPPRHSARVEPQPRLSRETLQLELFTMLLASPLLVMLGWALRGWATVNGVWP